MLNVILQLEGSPFAAHLSKKCTSAEWCCFGLEIVTVKLSGELNVLVVFGIAKSF